MKPDPQRVLEQTAQYLLVELLPHVAPRYRQTAVGMLGALLAAVREEFDRAAARRVEENAVLRALFGRAAAVVVDPALAARLREAAAGAEASLLVPALDASNRALRALLIELHAHLEAQSGPPASALAEEIWAELARSTERRRLALGAF